MASNQNASFALAVLLALASIAPLAHAKSATCKIVIEGGSLSQPLEITDPQILNLSNVWMGTFFDVSHDPVPEAPRGIGPYQISFYVKWGGEVQRKYVVYYHPRLSDPGYIYLPGSGDTWQFLNWGTVVRRGEDGKWHYALTEWEKLVKPLIAHADSLAKYWR